MTQALYLSTRAHVRDVQFTFSWHKQLLFPGAPSVYPCTFSPHSRVSPIFQRQTKSCPMIRPTCNSNHTEIGIKIPCISSSTHNACPQFIRSSAWTDAALARARGWESRATPISHHLLTEFRSYTYCVSCICGPNNQSDIRPASRLLLVGK